MIHSPEIQQYFQRRKTADHQPWKLSIPLSLTPILVFINPRSGGLYGSQLLPRFRRILHPIQVVDLQEKNPQEVLRNYVGVANLRILVCGGDISFDYILIITPLFIRNSWLGIEYDRERTLEALSCCSYSTTWYRK